MRYLRASAGLIAAPFPTIPNLRPSSIEIVNLHEHSRIPRNILAGSPLRLARLVEESRPHGGSATLALAWHRRDYVNLQCRLRRPDLTLSLCTNQRDLGAGDSQR